MSSDRLWILYGKKKDGSLSEDEAAELAALMAGPDGGGYTHEIMDQLWKAPLQAVPEMSMKKESWTRIEKNIGNGRIFAINTRALLRMTAAAILIGLITVTTLLYLKHKTKNPTVPAPQLAMNQVSTQNGSRTRLELPDGTQVWLNGNSQLRYSNTHFGTDEREIFLSGEAYFDVVKNDKTPFIIHTGDVTITVLGTAFNVRAYSREKTVETSLIRGMVAITTRKDPDRRIILKPNEKIILPVDSAAGTVIKPSAHNATPVSLYTIVKLRNDSTQQIPETVWMSSKLEFDNELLEDLAPRLERWYNISIHFRDAAIRRQRFSGVIEKETLEQTLEAMRFSGSFTYEIKGNELWIGKK